MVAAHFPTIQSVKKVEVVEVVEEVMAVSCVVVDLTVVRLRLADTDRWEGGARRHQRIGAR